MIYRMEWLRDRVRTALNRNPPERALFESLEASTLDIEKMIEMALPEAAMRVESQCDVEMLEGFVPFGEAVFWDTRDASRRTIGGRVALPPDFMRLIRFRMSDWERSVTAFTRAGTLGEALAASPVDALRGCPRRPRCLLEADSAGRFLRFEGSLTTAATVATALYLPLPLPDRFGGMAIARRCLADVIAECAATVRAQLAQA